MDKKPELLELLHKKVRCDYISCLRKEEYRERVYEQLQTIELTDYTYQEWSSALSYITGNKIEIKSDEDIKKRIVYTC